MKDHTQNSFLQECIHSNKRLYVITGKGGVGKTTFSLALTKHLHSQGKKAVYINFENNVTVSEFTDQDIPVEIFELEKSTELYMARKLKSETIASWIIKIPFFRAIFFMVPGLWNLIIFGHILDRLDKDEDLVVILDSPATGHALTMLESPLNFKKMFKTGMMVEDIDRTMKILTSEEQGQVILLSLPSELSIEEAIEAKGYINDLGISTTQIVINNSLKSFESEDLPCLLYTSPSPRDV